MSSCLLFYAYREPKSEQQLDTSEYNSLLTPYKLHCALSDQNLPFLSAVPLLSPLCWRNFIAAFVPPKLHLTPQPVRADTHAALFIFKSTVYVDICFQGAKMQYGFKIVNSSDLRVSLIGVLLLLSLCPAGNILVELPRKQLVEQMQGISRIVYQASLQKTVLNVNTDIVLAIYQEIMIGKNAIYYLGEGKRSRADFQECGVFYDNLRQQMAQQLEMKFSIEGTPTRMPDVALNLYMNFYKECQFLEAFRGAHSYYEHCEAMRHYCGARSEYVPCANEVSARICDFNGITYITFGLQEYAVKISNSTRYRRLLLVALILLLHVENNSLIRIMVNNAVLPVVLSSYGAILHDYARYADMDVLLVVEALAQQKNRHCVLTENNSYRLAEQISFLGQVQDFYHSQYLAALQVCTTTTTDNSAVTYDEPSTTAVAQASCSCSDIVSKKAPRLTKEYIRRYIEEHDFVFIRTSAPSRPMENYANFVLKQSSKAATHAAAVLVEDATITMQWFHGRDPKMFIQLENSTLWRRMLVGMLLVLLASPEGCVMAFYIYKELAPKLANVLYHRGAQNRACGDIVAHLRPFNFYIEPQEVKITGAICIGVYWDDY